MLSLTIWSLFNSALGWLGLTQSGNLDFLPANKYFQKQYFILIQLRTTLCKVPY